MTRSLGAMLAIGLAGLQFLAVLAVVFSSYVTSERALIRHARELLRDVGVNTIEHSKGFLSPAEGAAELAARLAQNRVIASDDPRLLEQLLFQQLQITPQIAGVYYGGGDGSFVYVMRSDAGPSPFRTKIITITDGKPQTRLIWRKDDFSLVSEGPDPLDQFDPRTRPWFVEASAKQTTIWTDPYIFFSSQQPGITLAAPVRDDAGGIRGVIGVDIEISKISEFLARLNIGETGKALIIHRNSDVIAHPNPELLKTSNGDGTLRFVGIRELGDPIARTAFGALARDNALWVREETPSQFVYDGARYVSTVMPVISNTLPWIIAVYAPESDFTAVIKQNRLFNIWIAVLVAAITGAVGLMLADFIHKPVRAFAVRSALIAQGEIDPSAPAPKTYTELERANAALVQQILARRTAEREYGQTFDLAARGMAQIDAASGTILRVNSRLCAISGFAPDELNGKRLEDLLMPGAGGRASADLLAVAAECQLIRKEGPAIWVMVNSILIRDQDGHPLHEVLTLDDITGSKDREAQIERLNKDLSHLARGNTMGQMAAGLAHELNQPLTAIAQNADTALLVLDQHKISDPELQEILNEIERQSLRAGDIIRALRGFIRKDEGTRTLFSLPELVGQTLRLLQAEATEAGVIIETRLDADLPEVSANRVHIAQVIVNLVRNAIEAMASDPGNERRVTIFAKRNSDHLQVSVVDTGPGLAAGISLFAQFETSKSEGMGLGLSISRSMIEANGGQLVFDDTHRPGARFSFTLPLPGHV